MTGTPRLLAVAPLAGAAAAGTRTRTWACQGGGTWANQVWYLR